MNEPIERGNELAEAKGVELYLERTFVGRVLHTEPCATLAIGEMVQAPSYSPRLGHPSGSTLMMEVPRLDPAATTVAAPPPLERTTTSAATLRPSLQEGSSAAESKAATPDVRLTLPHASISVDRVEFAMGHFKVNGTVFG